MNDQRITARDTQRVIKFRCWDHEEGVMLSDNHDGMMIQMNSGRIGHYDDDGNFQEGKYTIMQFTGLLDKHGKEIYDKDILRFVGGTCHALPCGNYGEHHTIGTLLIVKWLQSGWTLCPISHIDATTPNLVGHVDNYDFWNHHRSFERIGDAYTTPELVDPKMIEHGNS